MPGPYPQGGWGQSWLVLELDTTPPSLAWQQYVWDIATEEVLVQFSVVDGAVTRAWFEAGPDTVDPLDLEADRATWQLTRAAEEGIVYVITQDDVGNTATYSLQVTRPSSGIYRPEVTHTIREMGLATRDDPTDRFFSAVNPDPTLPPNPTGNYRRKKR